MKVSQVDLRSITRESDKIATSVMIVPSRHADKKKWLLFGEAQLSDRGNSSDGIKRWELRSYLKGATDFEHDSAYALVLPLICVTFIWVYYHNTRLSAIVDPTLGPHDDFAVPEPGYNPLEHEKTVKCTECEPNHLIVPEGLYIPPDNPELYKKVSGKEVQIEILMPREDQE